MFTTFINIVFFVKENLAFILVFDKLKSHTRCWLRSVCAFLLAFIEYSVVEEIEFTSWITSLFGAITIFLTVYNIFGLSYTLLFSLSINSNVARMTISTPVFWFWVSFRDQARGIMLIIRKCSTLMITCTHVSTLYSGLFDSSSIIILCWA